MAKKNPKKHEFVLVELSEEQQRQLGEESVASGRCVCEVVKRTTKRFLKLLRRGQISLGPIIAGGLLLLVDLYDYYQ
jgi:hypothetical protein